MVGIKTPEEIKIMTEGGKILAGIIKKLEGMVKPGIETNELNKAAEDLVLASGGICSFKGYDGYPACLCVSINEEIVHAAPSKRKLTEGDIVSLDLGIFYKGFHGDMAITVPVGKVKPEVKKLIEVTRKSLEVGIEKIKPGNYFGDISRAIQKYVESNGFNVVRELCGHGIGKKLHEYPQILNYDNREVGPELIEGMVFCIEPMITTGDCRIKKGKDGFSYETREGSLSCHFEHTIAVTQSG
ncbi:MAG: type I methionyl aminopeptidase, partial [Patescibacteria group bacterium]